MASRVRVTKHEKERELLALLPKIRTDATGDHTHPEYLTDAPVDGKQYIRLNGEWVEVT